MDKTQVFKQPKKSPKRPPNYYGIIVTLLLFVPFLLFLFGMGLDLMHDHKTKRFEGELVQKISDSQLQTLRQAIKGCQSYEVNLMSATLRVSCEVSQDQLEAVKKQAQELLKTVTTHLPIDQYFQNRQELKMYDFEIYVYSKLGSPQQLIYVISKAASASDIVHDNYSQPKDPDTTKRILHPDKAK